MWNTAVARRLVQAGARPSDELSWLLFCPWLRYLASDGRPHAVRFLLEIGASASSDDAKRGAVSSPYCLQLLLEHGTDVSATIKKHGTFLHEAIRQRNWDSVRLLVKHGADVHLQADVELSGRECAYILEWDTGSASWERTQGRRPFDVQLNAIELAAYLGCLNILNHVLETSYEEPDHRIGAPEWKRRSKAGIAFRKHVLRKG
jgi:hypothetical protein